MERFMLIVREDLKRIGRLKTEDRFAEGPDMTDWIKSLIESGNYIGGEPLAMKCCLMALLSKPRKVSADMILFWQKTWNRPQRLHKVVQW
jgi:hypothetical protein